MSTPSPALGAPLILDRASASIDQLIRDCMPAWQLLNRLHFIKVNWSGRSDTAEGEGSVEWILRNGSLLTAATRNIPQRFLAYAWRFEKRYVGFLRELPISQSSRPTSLVLARPLSSDDGPVAFFLDDDDDWYNIDESVLLDISAALSRIHPVYPEQPSGHELMAAFGLIRKSWPAFDKVMTVNGQ